MRFDQKQVAADARRLRKTYDIETHGISDIFSFINQQGIELIRYAFGKNTILGFATFYDGKKIIVSNSSEILAREIYTIAHELGHIIYDFEDDIGLIKIDKDLDKQNSISEERAYYFADCLLLPEEKLNLMLEEVLKKDGAELRAINIVQMQLEFNVSYSALLERLHSLGIITSAKKQSLYTERDFYTSKRLFAMLGADEDLLSPTDKLIVPPQYIDYVMSNYENRYIPLSSLKKALTLVNIDTDGLEESANIEEEESLDDLFEEYE